jgi:hypothetical protein
MNTLYGNPQAQAEKEHVVKNVTQFCYVGADDSSPKGCLPLGSTGVVVPPGRAVRKNGGLLPFILSNSNQFTFVLTGPKDGGALKELEALRARGVAEVGDVKEFTVEGKAGPDGKPVPETHIRVALKGVHLVLEDVTDKTSAVQKELLDDPNMVENLHKLSAELDAERAKAAAALAELAALKAAQAKQIPPKAK